jgi:uncharacterized protein YqeY
LTEDEELTVLSRELKQRKDSLHEFSNANRCSHRLQRWFHLRLSAALLQKAASVNKLLKCPALLDEELTVLSRELKQRKDSLHEFSNANRLDLVDKVQKELDILEVYLPKQLSEEELQTIVNETMEGVFTLLKFTR